MPEIVTLKRVADLPMTHSYWTLSAKDDADAQAQYDRRFPTMPATIAYKCANIYYYPMEWRR